MKIVQGDVSGTTSHSTTWSTNGTITTSGMISSTNP